MREPLRKTEGQYPMMAASKAERLKTHKKCHVNNWNLSNKHRLQAIYATSFKILFNNFFYLNCLKMEKKDANRDLFPGRFTVCRQ